MYIIRFFFSIFTWDYYFLKTDRLFFEFIQEVYKEKINLKNNIITDKDFNLFFHIKKEQSEQINSWTEQTIKKLIQIYKYILVESNLAERRKKDIYVTRPLMDIELVDYLKNKGDTIYVESMLGEI